MSATGEQIERPGLIAASRARLTRYLAKGGIAQALARGAAWSVGINVAGQALSFVVQVVLTRSLGRVQYGNYAYALAWMNTALLFAKLEMDTCSLRFIGVYDGAKSWSLLRGFLGRAARLVGFVSLGIAAVAALTVWIIASHLRQGVAPSLWAACALLPVTASTELKARCLHAFKKVPESQIPTLVLRPILFGLGVALATYAFHLRLEAPAAIGVNALAALIALLVLSRYLRRTIPREVQLAAPVFETRQWLHSAAGFLVIAAAQLVLGTQMDVVVIGSMLGGTQAGLYQIASQLASLVSFGITAIIYLALAMISDLHAKRLRAKLQHLVTLLSRVNLIVSLVVVILLAFLGTEILGLFGHSFSAAYPVLMVLASANFVSASVGILAGFLLTLTGHERQAAIVVVGGAVLNFTLSVVATRAFGAIGTASATAVTAVLRSGVLAFYCWKLLRILPGPFGGLREGSEMSAGA